MNGQRSAGGGDLPRREALLLAATAGLAALAGCPPRHPALTPPRLKLPRRRPSAPSGRAVMLFAGRSAPPQREERILGAVAEGNVPRFLRELVPIDLPGPQGRALRLWVCPDYLSVGDDEDHVRVPLSGVAAQTVAASLGAVLPTPYLVDAIHRAARVRLDPAPLKLGVERDWLDELMRHEAVVARQLSRTGAAPGAFVAGHKKDVVLTKRLEGHGQRVAIYGFHRGVGDPIQPLSLAHSVDYTDYSHGVRLIADEVHLDGEASSLRALLADEARAELVSAEGPVSPDPYG